jgi:hypothetical protein
MERKLAFSVFYHINNFKHCRVQTSTKKYGKICVCLYHRVYQSARLSFLSSELGPPPTPSQGSVTPPPLGSKGGDTPACGEGSGL